MPRTEADFESDVIDRLMRLYPGAYVIKNDANSRQGFPDRTFLYYDFWAAFDLKKSANADLQPNQQYYIDRLNEMSLAMFVYPENEEEFFYAIQRSLSTKR